MSYKQLLQDLLKEIERCESMLSVSKALDTVETINTTLEMLATGDWTIGITRDFKWWISNSGKAGRTVYEKLETDSFESFKDGLLKSVTKHLRSNASRKYASITTFKETTASVLELMNKVTEDVYEDVMYDYRRSKETEASYEKIVASIAERKQVLLKSVSLVAEAWVRENLVPGMEVVYEPPQNRFPSRLTVDKIVTFGGSTLITFKDSDAASHDFKDIDFIEAWSDYTDNAKDICDRIKKIG